jgi:hypothetical protein
MAKIWNWSVEGFSEGHYDITPVGFDTEPLPKGINVFAFTYLTKVESLRMPASAATTVAEAYIRGYWFWDANGNEQFYDFAGNVAQPNSWFIKNCSRLQVVLSVRSVRAKSNITLIEWN